MAENDLGEGSEDDLFVAPATPMETVEAIAEGLVAKAEAEDSTADVEVLDEPEEFDPKFRTEFEGLLYVGKLQRTFRWMGHKFTIRTPYISELLEIGQLHKPYSETVSDIKAYQALMVAAVVVSVDGKPLPIPITTDESDLESKFNYIQNHWYPWTLDRIYEQYLVLDARVQGVMTSMGKAPGSDQ